MAKWCHRHHENRRPFNKHVKKQSPLPFSNNVERKIWMKCLTEFTNFLSISINLMLIPVSHHSTKRTPSLIPPLKPLQTPTFHKDVWLQAITSNALTHGYWGYHLMIGILWNSDGKSTRNLHSEICRCKSWHPSKHGGCGSACPEKVRAHVKSIPQSQ